MSTKTFTERCHIAQQFLPDAQYKALLTNLHAEMLAALADQPAQQTGCTWVRPDSGHMPDTWEASCGAMWTFTEGGPKDNDLHFCPKCGKPAIEADKIKENA